jgi:hypothetical protein
MSIQYKNTPDSCLVPAKYRTNEHPFYNKLEVPSNPTHLEITSINKFPMKKDLELGRFRKKC